jgi:uncharacterized protein with HEPN domain
MPPDTLGVLEDILEAAQYIVDDTVGMTFEEFERDRRSRQLVERNFTIIGEAMNRLRRHDVQIAEQFTSYRKIVGFRNSLIHGYDTIDYSIVLAANQDALPVLRAEVESILAVQEDSSLSVEGSHK